MGRSLTPTMTTRLMQTGHWLFADVRFDDAASNTWLALPQCHQSMRCELAKMLRALTSPLRVGLSPIISDAIAHFT